MVGQGVPKKGRKASEEKAQWKTPRGSTSPKMFRKSENRKL